MKCPKCNGSMKEGELVDNARSVSTPQEWAEKATSVLFVGKKRGKKIVSYRCEKCGYLENYAK